MREACHKEVYRFERSTGDSKVSFNIGLGWACGGRFSVEALKNTRLSEGNHRKGIGLREFMIDKYIARGTGIKENEGLKDFSIMFDSI